MDDSRLDVRPPVDVCETCGSGQGYIWPMATDGDSSHMFVERCDMCDRFKSDSDAAFWLLGKLQHTPVVVGEAGEAYIASIHRNAPYIDLMTEAS